MPPLNHFLIKPTKVYFAALILLLALYACQKDQEEVLPEPHYIEQWLGTYEGVNQSNSTYPSGGEIVSVSNEYDMTIIVQQGSEPERVTIICFKEDTIALNSLTKEDILIDETGEYEYVSGAGSSYHSGFIRFEPGSVSYSESGQCGMFCFYSRNCFASKVN